MITITLNFICLLSQHKGNFTVFSLIKIFLAATKFVVLFRHSTARAQILQQPLPYVQYTTAVEIADVHNVVACIIGISLIILSLYLWATWDIVSIFSSWCHVFLVVRYLQMFCPFQKAKQYLVRQGVLIIGASRSHSDTPQSVGLLRTSDQLIVKNST